MISTNPKPRRESSSVGDQSAHLLQSRFGPILVEFSPTAVTRIRFWSEGADFGDQDLPEAELPWQRAALELLGAYLAGEDVDLTTIPVDLSAQTPFRRLVQEECRRIRFGETISYAELARRVGQPAAARAVGTAMKHNPVPILVPCHRVVKSDGGIGGYNAPQGVSLKEQLLALERN